MCAREREIGLVVIEGEVDPFRRLMAGATILSKLILMNIGFSVALRTKERNPHPLTVNMAHFTINLLMAAGKLETGKLMCE